MKDLKGFVTFLRTKCLRELAIEYLDIIKALEIPLVKLVIERNIFPEFNDEKGIELAMQGLERFLTSVETDTIFENTKKSLQQWRENKIAIPGISREDIRPSDLVLIYAAQKQSIIKFLPSYCISAAEAATLVGELENYYTKMQDEAVQTLFTIQKDVETKLKENEEKFRQLVQVVKDYAIFLLDDKGNIKTWNEGAENIHGYKAEEILGKHYSVFYTEEDKKKGLPEHNLVMAIKTGHYETESERTKKDGSSFWANVILTPMYNEKKQLTGFSKITRDITERKRMEESRQRLIAMLEATHDFVGFADAKSRQIQFMNAAGRKMTGLAYDEDVTKLTIDQVHPEWVNKLLQSIAFPAAIKYGIWEGECAFLNRVTGREIPVSMVLLTHKDSSGKIVRFSTISRDITRQKFAESELEEKSKELERSNKELEQFAYVASHDLQEPLRTVSSYVQLLAGRYEGKLDRDADEFIHYAVDGNNRMRSLINSLLEYSRINRVKPFEPINTQQLIRDILTDINEQVKTTGAAIVYDNLPDISGDTVLISQLFQNLIINALKFRSDKKPEVIIACKKRNGEYLFSVKDNGIGIQKEYWEKIFIIFQRLNNREQYPGTGIGLSICKKIVERHGGKIWVESEPGKGTTFYFTIKKNEIKTFGEKIKENGQHDKHTVN